MPPTRTPVSIGLKSDSYNFLSKRFDFLQRLSTQLKSPITLKDKAKNNILLVLYPAKITMSTKLSTTIFVLNFLYIL